MRGTAGNTAAEQSKGADGGGAAHTIFLQAAVVLIFLQGRVGIGTEVAVYPLLVEAELLQLLLELRDIVTYQLIRRLVAKYAAAERVRGLAQFAQGEIVDLARGHDTAGLLEGLEDLRQIGIKALVALGVLLLLPSRKFPFEI